MKSIINSILASFILIAEISGQANDPSQKILPPNPNAASLTKYVEFPVNTSTGIPTISVPLGSVEGRSLSTSVTLDYHAGGVKVDEVSGIVGLGWSINGGGVISRTVMGKQDDQDDGFINENNNIPTSPINTQPEYDNLVVFADGTLDGQPDIFQFNFGGYSGKFLIVNSTTINLIPKQDLKITPTYCSAGNCPAGITSGSIVSFKVRTPDGLVYTFGTNSTYETSTTFSENVPGYGGCQAHEFTVPSITSWQLHTIYNPRTNDVVTYTYTSYTIDYEASYNESFKYKSTPPAGFCGTGTAKSKCITNKTDKGKLLTSIVSSKGKIEFTSNTTRSDVIMTSGSYRITEAKVYGANNQILKSYSIYQSFVTAADNPPTAVGTQAKVRMYLDSITEFSSSAARINAWKFEYYFRNNLPPRLSFKQDHWGFYNNKNNVQLTPLPSYAIASEQYIKTQIPEFTGADREPNPLVAHYGTLKKITYPTGGSIEFEFESNEVAVCTSLNVPSDLVASVDTFFTGVEGNPPQVKTKDFTISTGQSVTVNYYVQQNGPHFQGAYVKLKRLSPTASTLLTQGQDMFYPIEISGSTSLYLSAGVYQIESKVFTPALGPGEPFPFSTYPDRGTITVFYTGTSPVYFDNKPTGGIRLKKSTLNTVTGNSADIVKSYSYVKSSPNCSNASSAKAIGGIPWYLTREYVAVDPSGIPCDYEICQYDRLSSSSFLPLMNAAGSIVTYEEVWEKQGLNAENGKTYFKHQVVMDVPPFLGPTVYQPFINVPNVDYSWKNAKLIEQKVYNAQNQVMSQKLMEYELNNSASQTIKTGFVAKKIFEPPCTGPLTYYCDGENTEGEEMVHMYEMCGLPVPDWCELAYSYTTPCYNQPAGTPITQTWQLEPFAYAWYDIVSQFVYLRKETERNYNSDGSGGYVESITEYKYDTINFKHYMPIKTIRTNSDGSQYATKTSYPPEFNVTTVTDPASIAIKTMVDSFFINSPVETVNTLKKSGTEYVTGGQTIKYKNFNGNFTFPNEEWKLGIITPILYSSFNFATISGGNFSINSNYYQTSTLGKYNTKGNLQEWNKKDDQVSSILYGQNQTVPTASVRNSISTECAYSSFEEPNIYAATGNGGWAITPASGGGWTTTSGYVQTGLNSMNMTGKTLTASSVPAGTYLVSFWHRSGTINVNGVAASTATTPLKYGEKTFTLSVSGSITVTGTGYIDELRLHPADALMRTFTYHNNSLLPLNFTDENSVTTYYEYDNSQRLQIIRDQDRNILQTYEYTYNQSPGLNTIKSRKVLITGQSTLGQVQALTEPSVNRQFQYVDGLGRPIQSNATQQSPAQNDIVTYQVYDAFGREPKNFIPYTIATNGGVYRTSAASEQTTFTNTWGAGGYGYAETRFEASPLNRELEQASPGATWRIGLGHTTEKLYRGNLSTEAVRDFTNNTNFADNKLRVIEELDENERKKITYTDKLGRVVMVKQQLAPAPTIEDDHWSRTYTVYDDFGRIAAIIPPEAARKMKQSANWDWTAITYKSMIFKYAYDSRGRVISKTVPGGVYANTEYDRLDRPVLTTDANGFKVFTRYDILGRPVVSGRYKGSATPGASDPLYESPNTTSPHYYTSVSFPTDNNLDVYKVYYYDDHDIDNNGSLGSTESYTNPAESGYDATAFSRTRGKGTAEKVAILKNDNTAPTTYLTTRTYYDKEFSVIQVNKQNHLSGADITSNGYDFANRLVKMRREHTATPPGGTLKTYTIREEYIYDYASRLRFTRHKINSGLWVVIAAPTYDEMDRLADRRLHASNYDGVTAVTLSSSFNYLQSMDYTYNIRSWMTDINNVSSCSIQSGDQLADMFKLQLSYDAPVGGGTAQYNGNISTMQWGTYINSTCLPQQQYRVNYDAADRITAADHWTNSGSWVNTNNYSESNITYDLNGNIRTYTRRGLTLAPSTYGIIDQLTYSYGDAVRPDLLTDVQDAGSLTKGFVDNASSGTNYLYDANGNLTQDIHKTMVFTYNHHNLPNSLVKDGISNVTWTYTADGEKLTKIGPGGTRNYVSGIEYLGANTDAIYHAEGRCMPNGSSWYYDYTLKDHLGDARVNFRANGTAVTYLEDFHYYPFGMQMEGLGTILSTGNDYRYNGKELNEDYSLNWYDYGARWYDPAVGKWTSTDPLANKYPMISPYCYANNNAIRYIDPDGREIVDPKGNKVVVTKLNDGSLSFSKNATKDIIRTANALSLTQTGSTQLNRLITSEIKVGIIISKETKSRKVQTGLAYTFGETIQGNFNEKDNYGKLINPDGSYGITEATITIFEGSLLKSIEDGSSLKHEGLSLEQAIGAVAGHESVHAVDKQAINNDLKAEQNGKSNPLREEKPNKIESKIIQESKIKKNE